MLEDDLPYVLEKVGAREESIGGPGALVGGGSLLKL
jgi:hypothetical protein